MTLLPPVYNRVDANTVRVGVNAAASAIELPRTELYETLWSYYLSNGLYDDLSSSLRQAGESTEAIKELRNPVHRVVEFHAAKLWAGNLPRALPIIASRPAIIDPIHQLWAWGNWANKKQLASRYFGLFGDLFIKVAERVTENEERRVFHQVLDPRHVTEFSVDERGYVQRIRIDVPQTVTQMERGMWWDTPHPVERATYWTEVWDKKRVRIWNNPGGTRSSIDALPKPGASPGERDEEHGLGFVPVVWAPFKDIGDGRGLGVVTPFLSKIDECNRMATRLHQMLFRYNKVLWALKANQVDPTGRPLPPPRIASSNGTAIQEAGRVTFADEAMIQLPGMSDLAPLIPSIDYGSALQILNAMLEELKSDLPELRYYEAQASSNVSGVALRYALADAIDRVLEARGNGEAALARANAMGLTLGQRAQIKGFEKEKIGTFEAGDFDHHFADRPIIELTGTERATVVSTWVQGGVPLKTALRREGWADDEIKQMEDDRLAEVAFQLEIQKRQQDAAQQLEKDKAQHALEMSAVAKQQEIDAARAKGEQDVALEVHKQRTLHEVEQELAPQRLDLIRKQKEVETGAALDAERRKTDQDATLVDKRADTEARAKRTVGQVELEQQAQAAQLAQQLGGASSATSARNGARRRMRPLARVTR